MSVLQRRLVGTALAFGLVLAGCSSGDSTASSGVQPIEPILAGEIRIDTDPSGTSATLAVDTTIPVACSVIYGQDDSFGSIAVDSDMQGGAHEDHGPLLVGLAPDTEYKYILQGSDAAGTIYRSEVMTFTTPVAEESTLGQNLASGGTIIGTSSEFSDTFAADNAIDGDPATEWSTAGDGNDAWIEIDLGQDEEIGVVAFRTRQMTDGSAITQTFTVTIAGTSFGPYPAGTDPVVLDQPVTGRVVRFDADETSGGNTGATEVEIYPPS